MNDAFLTSIKFYDRKPISFMKLMKGNKNEYIISQIPLDCITCVGARFQVFYRYRSLQFKIYMYMVLQKKEKKSLIMHK